MKNYTFLIILSVIFGFYSPNAEGEKMKHKYTNKLINEKSQYLLEHAHNPVNWYPWGREAFDIAKKLDKPIFLSIGYATCHWCHVMAKESFENEGVAELLNDTFIAIKVDREERPDIDSIYMDVCNAVTGRGGWPLTIFMTAEKKPFFAGTYIPREGRFGSMGLKELIKKVKISWDTQRKQLISSAEKITDYMKKINTSSTSTSEINKYILDQTYSELESSYDITYGGFGSQPKFPTPHRLTFLLRYWKHFSKPNALNIVKETLRKMRSGGIFDQIGFGFHRYSTDKHWLVPHFEKMLYDQALLIIAYSETYQATKDTFFANCAKEILTYIERDMTSPEGAFYTAEDADSDGEEGKFYVWSAKELKTLLTKEEYLMTENFWGVTKEGNFNDEASGKPTSNNIFFQKRFPDKLNEKKLNAIRKKLFNIRETRIHPLKDTKILADWNGLMIAAMAIASRATAEEKYLKIAEKALKFILNKMSDKKTGGLFHRYREGDAAIHGKLADYASIIWACIELYQTTLKIEYLNTAIYFTTYVNKHFSDTLGGYFMTSDYDEKLITRPKTIYDGAIPSANSIMLLNLMRISRITGNIDLEKIASNLVKTFAKQVNSSPRAFTQFLSGIDFIKNESFEIVVVGKENTVETENILSEIKNIYLPNSVIIFKSTSKNNQDISQIIPYTKNQVMLNKKTTVYICKGYTCTTPLTNIKKIRNILNGKSVLNGEGSE